MNTSADVGSFIESKTSVVQTSNVGFTSEVPDYLVVHMGPEPSLKYRMHDTGVQSDRETTSVTPRRKVLCQSLSRATCAACAVSYEGKSV